MPVSIIQDKIMKNEKSSKALTISNVLGTQLNGPIFLVGFPSDQIPSTALDIASCDKISLSLCFFTRSKFVVETRFHLRSTLIPYGAFKTPQKRSETRSLFGGLMI